MKSIINNHNKNFIHYVGSRIHSIRIYLRSFRNISTVYVHHSTKSYIAFCNKKNDKAYQLVKSKMLCKVNNSSYSDYVFSEMQVAATCSYINYRS